MPCRRSSASIAAICHRARTMRVRRSTGTGRGRAAGSRLQDSAAAIPGAITASIRCPISAANATPSRHGAMANGAFTRVTAQPIPGKSDVADEKHLLPALVRRSERSKTMSQISLTFPDGSTRAFKSGVTGRDVAESILKSLAKKAVAVQLDGHARDLAEQIKQDARIRILTRDDPEALELIRHDAAHVMAEAVQELYPGTLVTIGPVIEN